VGFSMTTPCNLPVGMGAPQAATARTEIRANAKTRYLTTFTVAALPRNPKPAGLFLSM